MDKRRIKTGKGELQNNERRKEAEMFVLPPDILEKLGINLGQFTSHLPHPGTSHDPEASKAKYRNDKTSVSNSTVNNGDLTTESKRKASKTFVPADLPNADDNINKSEEYHDPSVLQKLLHSEAALANATFTSVSADQGTSNTQNSMSTFEASQENKCSSSILETASLMKKSVLLSPTFCNTDFNPNTTCDQISEWKESSVVPVTLICTKNVNKRSETPTTANAQSPSYVEIWTANVNTDNELKGDNNLDKNLMSSHESTTAIDSAHWKTNNPEIFAGLSGPSNNTNNVNTMNSIDSNMEANKVGEEFAFSTKYRESNNNNNFIRSTVSSDCDDSQISAISTVGDHLDEIYSSDASHLENKNKIKIISEQIINSVQLKQIQNVCASHKSNFMPVSVETLIRKTPESGEFIDNNSSMYIESEFRETEGDFNGFNDKDKSIDMKAPRNLTETAKVKQQLQNNNSTPNDLIHDYKQTTQSKTETQKACSKKNKSINESIPDLNSSSIIDKADHSSNNKSIVTEEKVKEIATYLVQLIKDRNNKQHKKVESSKRIYKCYKRNPHKAKLVSQGVEKPGGINEIKKDSVNETELLLQEPQNCINMDLWISTDDIICIGTTSETHELTQKLCVCVEFGKLDYYHWDNYYENIHFWYHKKDVCEPELCFNIYNDGEVSRHIEDDIQILDVSRVSASDILINNSKSVEKSEVISEGAPSSNTPVNTPIVKKPGKCGRPKKNTTKDKMILNDSVIVIDNKPVEESEVTCEEVSSTPVINTPVADNLKTVEESEVTCEELSSTPVINTPVAKQPDKRGRGRPKKISIQTETDFTIYDRKSSSKDQHHTDKDPSQMLSSTSSSDEPLISKRAEISPIIKTHVKKEQTDNVLSECEVSCDVNSIANSSISNNTSRCAICKEEVTNENWFEHRKIHNYLAWRDTEPALDLDDEYEVIRHLTLISKEKGSLVCSKCRKQYKTPKSYYGHVQSCNGGASKMNTSTASDLNTTQELHAVEKTRKKRKRTTVDEIVECGVCKESVKNVDWIEHIRVKHNYMAKRAGEIPLDENNEEQVKEHLYNICKYHDGLICNKCGLKRKYLKSYFNHLIACNGSVEVKEPEIVKLDIDCNEVVKCGVCKLDVYGKLWIDHIEKVHKYLAWIEGEPPLDLDDPQKVHEHLHSIAKMVGFLRCWVCSETRKIVKIFLQHVKLCESSGFEKLEPVEKNPSIGEDQFECGVCHEVGFKNQWKQHAMSKHYNIAWMVGQMPINLRNPYAVEKYLKEYKNNISKNTLVCKVCGETRVSCYGFYAHIMICGKTEAELESLQNMCEICNKKYVCIYKNQHMASHRDSEMRKERRERDAILMEEKRQRELDECIEPGTKRKAAERASKVIQDLKQEDDEGPTVKRSRCDSEDSVKIEETNEGESSDDVDIDSDVSEEALEVDGPMRDRRERTKRSHHSMKIRRLPFKVDHFSSYVRHSYEDFCAYHFTDDCLFNDWRHADLQLVSESISEYLPTGTKSCNFKYGDNKWTSYKLFEAAKIGRAFILYTGGCIQCLSWAPQPRNLNEDFYFAVSTHRGPDIPRFDKDSTPVHSGFIQIWSMTDFGVLPEFSLGLVHDYGTIWAMDWCPSGARDILPDREENFTKYRLGLLAIACSNGFAYVLSVPYPNLNQSEVIICKAVVVAELRLNTISNKEIYQATAVTWSTQKGHSIIVVGYADGSTALYDLTTKSPLLTKKENNITILYPFQNKRTENGPISGVSVTPSMECSRSVGGVCAGGAGGASAWSARRGATLRTPLPATGAASTHHWPSYLLYAELAVSSKVVNELEWMCGGRRAGGACAGGACPRCACAVLSAPPALRLVRAHPCYPEPRRPVTLATLRMVPLSQKPIIKKDDLSMVIEPLTYEDTVSKYGLELKMTVKNKDPPKLPNELEQRPERFPLSDVTAISFCPSDRYHNRVAIASHAGLVFILNAPD